MDFEFVKQKGGLWYLASPYSHPDPEVRERRAWAAARCAGRLYDNHSIRTFCPIAHSHMVEVEMMRACWDGAHKHGQYWLDWDEAFDPACVGLIAACLPDWGNSKGMAHEIPKYFYAGKPVVHLYPWEEKWFTEEEWMELCRV